MEDKKFKELLLKTAFSVMACDGEIDPREVLVIKKLHKEKKIFGDIDINHELDNLLRAINRDGFQFLKEYFKELAASKLSEQDELKLIEAAIRTITADDKIEYCEIKFFKVIRSKLKIGDEPILESHPDFEEYLEQDIISESYLAKLQDDFFETQSLPKFELISSIDDDLLKNLDRENES